MTFKHVLNPVLKVPVIESDQRKFRHSQSRKHRQSYPNDQHHYFTSLQYSFLDARKNNFPNPL